MLGHIGSSRRARCAHQPQQGIGGAARLAEQELDRLADQFRPRSVRAFRQRAEAAILGFGQVKLDAYHRVCMIHTAYTGKCLRYGVTAPTLRFRTSE